MINPLNGRLLVRSLTFPLTGPELTCGLARTGRLQVEYVVAASNPASDSPVSVRVTPDELQKLRCFAMGGTDCE